MLIEESGMETIDRIIEDGQVSVEQNETLVNIEGIREDVELISRRLDRLAKLQSLLKEKYHKRLVILFDQLDSVDKQQCERKSLVKQLKRNKERASILKKQISDLKRRKKTTREAIKQVTGYEKSSSKQVEMMEEEQEVIRQRVQDLMQTLDIAEQARLSGNELDLVRQRVCATKELLEEHEIYLRKRTIDLLFEFYIPPDFLHFHGN